MNNSQARTGHQRVMGGRGTDDDDTHERHTDYSISTKKHNEIGLEIIRTHTLTTSTSCGPLFFATNGWGMTLLLKH